MRMPAAFMARRASSTARSPAQSRAVVADPGAVIAVSFLTDRDVGPFRENRIHVRADREKRSLRVRSLPAADDVSDAVDRDVLKTAFVHEFDDALRPDFFPEGGSRNFAELDLKPHGGVRAVVNVFERFLNFGESRNGLERIPGRG